MDREVSPETFEREPFSPSSIYRVTMVSSPELEHCSTSPLRKAESHSTVSAF
jgi:hypothetical protein